MRYTEHGLQIPLEELRRLLEYAENRVKYDNMEPCVYISPGDRPRILQYCCYVEVRSHRSYIRREIIYVGICWPQPYHSGWACNIPCLGEVDGAGKG